MNTNYKETEIKRKNMNNKTRKYVWIDNQILSYGLRKIVAK